VWNIANLKSKLLEQQAEIIMESLINQT
jgi:hypothetical protein